MDISMNKYSALLTELGIIITEDKKTIVKAFAFDDAVSDYLKIKSGKIPRSCRDLKGHLESLNTTISTGDEALFAILRSTQIDVRMLKSQDAEDARTSKLQLMTGAGFTSDDRDAVSKLREFAIGLASSKVTEVSSSADLHVIQAVNSLDEVDKVANALSSRIKEWYGLHFPELDNIVDGIEGYARIVLAGRRDSLATESFEDVGFPETKAEMLTLAARNSRGGDISDGNLEIVQSMAEQVIMLYELRKKLESSIEEEMIVIAPNLSAILGTLLSARILARIGSLKRMSTLPASTLQVLGAERALFRSLRMGTEPPKHGLLFQHPMVHAAPRWQRGKIARAIAAKAAIATRVDVYGDGLNKTLLEKLNIKIGEIEEKFDKPREYDGRHDGAQRQAGTYVDEPERQRIRGDKRSRHRKAGGGARHADTSYDGSRDVGSKHMRRPERTGPKEDGHTRGRKKSKTQTRDDLDIRGKVSKRKFKVKEGKRKSKIKKGKAGKGRKRTEGKNRSRHR